MPVAPGTTLGPYLIQERIGEGGMGAVYRALDTRLERTVAIKVIDGHFSERFEREAKTIASLNHPHICTLFDVGENYLVMEFIDGKPLEGPLPAAKAAEFATQILAALDAAHRKGITHRDLKPGNILVSKQGIKLVDFGLAKQATAIGVTDATVKQALTQSGQILGTLHYMAPEQLQGKEADARSDLFGFGCVLYEMVTGKRAFEGASAASVIAAILEREPAPMDEASPFTRIVQGCLAKDPDDRFQSARDVRRAFEWAAQPSVARETPKPARGRWLGWSVAAVLAIAVIAVAGMTRLPRGQITGRNIKFTPIATEDARETTPVFSPDGKSVAYYRRSGSTWQLLVRVLDSDEPTVLADKLVSNTLQLLWSADGNRVYYNDRGLSQIGVAGGTPVMLRAGSGAPLARMPGGKALLGVGNRGDGQGEFMEVDFQSGVRRSLKDVEPLSTTVTSGLQFSPDGRKLAACIDQGVLVWEWPHGKRRLLPLRLARTPHWYPDNRHLLVATFAERRLIGFDTDTGESAVIRSNEEVVRESTLSPDGTRIIYSSGPVFQGLVEHSISGERIRPLTVARNAESAGRWTPDGRAVFFRRFVTQGAPALFVRDEQSGRVRQLVKLEPSGAVSLDPAPDSKRLAYTNDGKIWTISTSGGPSLAVANVTSSRHSVSWSPDGAWIVYRMGDRIYKTGSQGGSPPVPIHRVAHADAPFATGEKVIWNAAGIYFREGSNLVRIAPDGGSRVDLGSTPEQLVDASPDGRLLYGLRSDERGASLVTRDSRTGAELRSAVIESEGDVRIVSVHPDGKRMAVEIADFKFDLWMMEGFPRPAVGWERLFWKWVE